LPARVERTRDLRAAERSVVEQAAVFARKRHALRDALVDDVHRELREPVDVGLACAIIAALDGVVEQPLHAVAVVLVVLGGVDAPLRGDAVRAARAVVDAEALDVVAELAQRAGGRGPGEAGAHDDDRELAPVRRVHQLRLEAVPIPLALEGTAGNLGIQNSHRVRYTQIGIIAKPAAIRIASTVPAATSRFVYTGWLAPSDWNALEIPWRRWKPMSTMQNTYTATQIGDEN